MNENEYTEMKLFWLMVVRWALLIIGGLLIVTVICLNGIPSLYRVTATANAEARLHRTDVDSRREIIEARGDFIDKRIYHKRLVMERFLEQCEDRIEAGQVAFPHRKECLQGIVVSETAPDTSGG